MREGRRVVHAVAGHRHDAAPLLEVANDVLLVRGKNFRANVVDLEFLSHSHRRNPAVARHHDNSQALVVQTPDRIRGRRLDRIHDGNQPPERSVNRQKHHRVTSSSELVGTSHRRVRRDARFAHHCDISELNAMPIDEAFDPLAR